MDDGGLVQAITAGGGAAGGSALMWLWVRAAINELKTELSVLRARSDALFEKVVRAEAKADAAHRRMDDESTPTR